MSHHNENECNGPGCETETKKTGGHGECCPVEKSIECWEGAFMSAVKEVKTEILKEKIKKTWGAKMEKEADAVLKAMETCWTTTIEKAKSQKELREQLIQIMSS